MMSHIEKLIGLRTGLGNGQPRPNINTYLEDKVATPSNLLNPSRRVEILDQKSAAKNPWTSNCMPPDTEVGTSVYGIKKPNARHWSSPNQASARWKRGNGPEHFLDTIPSRISILFQTQRKQQEWLQEQQIQQYAMFLQVTMSSCSARLLLQFPAFLHLRGPFLLSAAPIRMTYIFPALPD